MRFPALLGVLISTSIAMLAQAPAAATASPPSPAGEQGTVSASSSSVLPELDRLQAVSSALNGIISQLKIEKWKADGNSKRQAEANAESIQRNLNSALPGMIASVRSAPQDMGAEFKLYRNVNALYEVMSSLAESAGAFGPKGDYEALAQQLDGLDNVRLRMGDSLEQLTVSTQAQLEQLRTQVKTLQTQANAAPPKKTVVEDTEPAKKTSTSHKTKTKKPDANSGTTTSNPQ